MPDGLETQSVPGGETADPSTVSSVDDINAESFPAVPDEGYADDPVFISYPHGSTLAEAELLLDQADDDSESGEADGADEGADDDVAADGASEEDVAAEDEERRVAEDDAVARSEAAKAAEAEEIARLQQRLDSSQRHIKQLESEARKRRNTEMAEQLRQQQQQTAQFPPQQATPGFNEAEERAKLVDVYKDELSLLAVDSDDEARIQRLAEAKAEDSLRQRRLMALVEAQEQRAAAEREDVQRKTDFQRYIVQQRATRPALDEETLGIIFETAGSLEEYDPRFGQRPYVEMFELAKDIAAEQGRIPPLGLKTQQEVASWREWNKSRLAMLQAASATERGVSTTETRIPQQMEATQATEPVAPIATTPSTTTSAIPSAPSARTLANVLGAGSPSSSGASATPTTGALPRNPEIVNLVKHWVATQDCPPSMAEAHIRDLHIQHGLWPANATADGRAR